MALTEVAENSDDSAGSNMRCTLASLVLLIGSANSLSLGLAPARRSAVHQIVMQVNERQPH
jgi:hypothetical protein